MATFTNQATLSYQDTVILSNVVTGELLEALSVTKTAVEATYGAGDTVTYVVSLVNTGAACCSYLTVSDTLGAYPFGEGTLVPLDYVEGSVKYYINGVLQPAPAVGGTPLSFTGISVPAGGNATLVYSAVANAYAPLGPTGAITNTVTVKGECLAEGAEATETVTAKADGALFITKAMSPTTVAVGDVLTYTLTVENYGTAPIVATDGAVVNDTFAPILSGITVTLDGTPLAQGTGYTYNEATGAFATLPGVLTVPAATAMQDPVTGGWTLVPGEAVLRISGTVSGT